MLFLSQSKHKIQKTISAHASGKSFKKKGKRENNENENGGYNDEREESDGSPWRVHGCYIMHESIFLIRCEPRSLEAKNAPAPTNSTNKY